jgi:hypothetical protein
MLELVDEHRFRSRDEEARVRGRGCAHVWPVQVEYWPSELGGKGCEQRALADRARSGKDDHRFFGDALTRHFE